MRFQPFLRLLLLSILAAPLAAAQQHIAPTPPMGWNSWDAYGLAITEPQFRDNVNVLRDKLLPFGYQYAVIDEGWFFTNPDARPHPETLHYVINPYGQYVPDPARFPSAATGDAPVSDPPSSGPAPQLAATVRFAGFEALGAWVHAQKLKFGIHIVRGIPRASVERRLPIEGSNFNAADAADTTDACPWDPTNWGVRDNAAGQQWYDALMRQYATWGVDLLKVDCISDHPYKASEIRMIQAAIKKSGRPIVLSLSPGPTNPSHAAEVSELATMWRISDDVWDVWSSPDPNQHFPQPIRGQFDRAAQWVPLDLPSGRYPDLDMLPIGELRPSPGWGQPRSSRLTPDEQRTLLTLWALNRSPLILGANLTLLDKETLDRITNRDMLDIDQHGTAPGRSQPNDLNTPLPSAESDLQIWSTKVNTPTLHNAETTAVFNRGDHPLTIRKSLADLNLVHGPNAPQSATVFDIWSRKSLGRVSTLTLTIPAHGVVLLQRR